MEDILHVHDSEEEEEHPLQEKGMDDFVTIGTKSDTELGMEHLREEFCKQLPSGCPPVVLVNQLYALMDGDRTAVDQDLRNLCLAGKVRKFRIPSSRLRTEMDVVVFLHDFHGCIHASVAQARVVEEGEEEGSPKRRKKNPVVLPVNVRGHVEFAKVKKALLQHSSESRRTQVIWSVNKERQRVLETFRDVVLPAIDEEVVGEKQLKDLLKRDGKPYQSAIRWLMEGGFLIRFAEDVQGGQERFLFSIPHIGSLLHSMSVAQTEILRMLKRKRLREVEEKRIMERKIRGCSLPLRYVLLEMRGSGMVERMFRGPTPVIRLL